MQPFAMRFGPLGDAHLLLPADAPHRAAACRVGEPFFALAKWHSGLRPIADVVDAMRRARRRDASAMVRVERDTVLYQREDHVMSPALVARCSAARRDWLWTGLFRHGDDDQS